MEFEMKCGYHMKRKVRISKLLHLANGTHVSKATLRVATLRFALTITYESFVEIETSNEEMYRPKMH